MHCNTTRYNKKYHKEMIMCEDENITSSFSSKFDNYFFNKFTKFSILNIARRKVHYIFEF